MASVFSIFFALYILSDSHASADVVYEDGYTVSTVLDGHKLQINPRSILPRFRSSDFIILDSDRSAFYTVSFAASQEIAIKLLSGNGIGFADGDLAKAKFDKPKSFAVDFKGNIYVADKTNHAIRKISKSGVTTIAGNNSKNGHEDGPGWNATFSSDFELSFDPETCALLICDHGHMLVRQIKLKSEDCAYGSQSGLGVSAWAWALGLAVSSVLGMVIGFAVRPCISACGGSSLVRLGKRWKHYLIKQGRPILMFCSDIISAIVSSRPFTVVRQIVLLSLSHLSLMFRIHNVEPQTLQGKPLCLLDSNRLGSEETTKPEMFSKQLKDLISLDGDAEIPGPADEIFEHGDDNEHEHNFFSEGHQKIDNMIQANIMAFEGQARRAPLQVSLMGSSGLIKRRCI